MARLDVSSRLDRIRRSIPMESNAQQRAEIERFRKPVVLYIDDEPAIRELVEALLGADSRFELVVAEDGIDGLAQAQLLRPRLVLLDVQMPRLNGFEVCAALRSSTQTRDARIVMVTALGERRDVDRGLAAGADDYVPKPFRYTDLLRSVEAYLGLEPQPDEAPLEPTSNDSPLATAA